MTLESDTPNDERAPDESLVIKHHDRADSHLLFVPISGLWVVVVRKYNDGQIYCRLLKGRQFSDKDDELADLTPL